MSAEKSKFITLEQATFESLLDRIGQAADSNFEKKVRAYEKTAQEINDKIKDQEEKVRRIDSFMWIVVAVMFIGFAALLAQVGGMVIEAWRFDSSVYQSLKETQLQSQNTTSSMDQQKIIDSKVSQNDFNDFKNCLKSGAWNNCFK